MEREDEGDQSVSSVVLAMRTWWLFSPSRDLEEWSITPKMDQILWLVLMDCFPTVVDGVGTGERWSIGLVGLWKVWLFLEGKIRGNDWLGWVGLMSINGVGGSRLGRVRLTDVVKLGGGKTSVPVSFGFSTMAWWSPGVLLTSDAQSAPIKRKLRVQAW